MSVLTDLFNGKDLSLGNVLDRTFASLSPNSPEGAALANFANYMKQNQDDQAMRDIFSANPQFASALYGAKNNQAQTEIERNKLLAGGNRPSALQEWEYYNKLSPEDQQRYLGLKRQQQYLNLGGQYYNPQTNTAIEKTLAPQDLPETKAAQAGASELAKLQQQLQLEPKIKEATTTAQKTGEAKGTLEEQRINAPIVKEQINKALELLPKATSGGAQTDLASIQRYFGSTPSGGEADTQLDIIAGKLVGLVPKLAGSQSNIDLDFYKQQAGNINNTRKTIKERQAAANYMLELANAVETGDYSSVQKLNKNSDVIEEDFLTQLDNASKAPAKKRLKYNPATGEFE